MPFAAQIVPLLALSRDKHILLLKQLAQRAVLVHRHQDVGAADELVGNVELRNSLPIAVLLDSCVPSSQRHIPPAHQIVATFMSTYLT